MKRHAAIVSLAEKHSNLETAALLKRAWLYMFRVKVEMIAARFDGRQTFKTGNEIVCDMALWRQ